MPIVLRSSIPLSRITNWFVGGDKCTNRQLQQVEPEYQTYTSEWPAPPDRRRVLWSVVNMFPLQVWKETDCQSPSFWPKHSTAHHRHHCRHVLWGRSTWRRRRRWRRRMHSTTRSHRGWYWYFYSWNCCFCHFVQPRHEGPNPASTLRLE